jgi:dTDP-4-amino-4,6-dideoxygalactose transaminase
MLPPPQKTVTSLRDLAINGAPPMFPEPLHVGRPNIGNKDAFLAEASAMLDRGWLSNNGPLVQELERRVCEYIGVRHCVAMCNGTIALEIATRALGLTGEVIVPSYTFVATAHALQWQEITPIFADIDPRTQNLDPAAVERMITPKTTGIIGVHLWGRPAPVAELQALAEKYRLRLMFDASHGFGCTHGGRRLGGFGECEVFSFHATKFFNTFEGGAVVTNDDELAEKMRLMRNFGFVHYDRVIYPGTNGKMTEVSAAMGLANLESIDRFIAVNLSNYQRYREGLSNIANLALIDYDEHECNNYQYVVLAVGAKFPVTRDRLIEALHAEGVLARRYFWPGAHSMEPYRSHYPHAGLVLPNTADVAQGVIVLPTGTTIGGEHIHGICSIVRALAESHGS